MPEAIIEAELWDTFGSRSEYRAAPLLDAIRQRLRIIAKHEEEARQQAEQEAKQAELERAIQRGGR